MVPIRSRSSRSRSSLSCSSLTALLAVATVTACAPGRVVEGVEPETSVEILREIQLTDQAFFPEQEGTLVEALIESDRLVLTYDGAVPAFAVDQVISGVMHGGYLRRITEVGPSTVNGAQTSIELLTVPAELGELIGDGHFIAHFRPGTETFLEVPGADPDVGGAAMPLTGSWSALPVPLGASIECVGGGSSSVDVTPRFDMNIGMDVEIDIRWTWRWLIPRGELNFAKFELTGSVEPGVQIATSSSATVTCSWNIRDWARGRGARIPKREWVTTFAVGPVPVAITHTIEPEFGIEVGGSVQTGASTLDASAVIGFTAGAQYTQASGWQPIWRPRREGNISLNVAEPGTLSVHFTASGGIGYLGKIYDVAGPGVSLGPSATATFNVLPDRCEWTGDVVAGIDLTGRVRLDIPVIDYTLAEYSVTQSLISAEVARGMGRFPWPQCDEMPMPPGPPGPGVLLPPPGTGGTTPPGGSGGPTPGGPGSPLPGGPSLPIDPPPPPPPPPPPMTCAEATGCVACNEMPSCGFCESTGACMNDSEQGSCPGGTTAWKDGVSECRDCSIYGDCTSCLGDAFCGWCGGGGGCMTAEVGGGPPDTCGGGWVYTSTSLCGG